MKAKHNAGVNRTRIREDQASKNQHRRVVVVVRAFLCRQRCIYDNTWNVCECVDMLTLSHLPTHLSTQRKVAGKEKAVVQKKKRFFFSSLNVLHLVDESP